MRIDIHLTEKTDFSRSRIAELIKKGEILVNGKKVKPSYILADTDKIQMNIQEPVEIEIIPENIPLDIIYEDEDVAVINKPKGMVVHPAPGNFSGTLVNALLHHCPLSSINGEKRPGIVHRIDKDTTGLIIIAKNDFAHQSLATQFAEHTIDREYIALCFGSLKEKITINKPIGRNEKDRKKMAITIKNSKNAVTHIEPIEHFVYKNRAYTLIKAKLETGRTHQIRVHMAHIGHPLVGDYNYSNTKQPFGEIGQVLHARKLGFFHYRKNERMVFGVEEHEEFKKILKILGS